MNNKIIDLFEVNKDSGGQMLPIEKEIIIKNLGEVPRNVASEYCDAFEDFIEDLIIMKSIISSSNKPHLVKHLIVGLSEIQFKNLNKIINILIANTFYNSIDEIVNATLGITLPTSTTKEKAEKVIELARIININYEENSNFTKTENELADAARLIKTLCGVLLLCRKGAEVESCMKDRLSMAPESDLDWLIQAGLKLASNS